MLPDVASLLGALRGVTAAALGLSSCPPGSDGTQVSRQPGGLAHVLGLGLPPRNHSLLFLRGALGGCRDAGCLPGSTLVLQGECLPTVALV